ncbi:glycosyltransferase family 2 protein [Mesorhizobium sp.]|uniref:glycosyltransferase family 2 protein n=1 Tax=Mesorhizobium sp. TaxID=1871066 RepID=UPI0025CCA231|nr:glycosyltransferase family 2 protein [Mesorhizobium sp.]
MVTFDNATGISSDAVELTRAGARRAETALFVVVPAYNEEKSIEATVKGVATANEALAAHGVRLSILIVNDGSEDRTEELAIAAGADVVVTHKKNRGLGAAVRSGMEEATKRGADIVVKFDADLQHDPKDIIEIIQPILSDHSDLVYGARFSRISYKMPLVRRWGNRAFRALMQWLTKWPVEDSQPGVFACNRAYLAVFDIPGDYNYTQQILLDAFLKGMRFSQVPISFHERKTGESFVSMKYPFRVLRQIVVVLAISKPMKIFGTIGSGFILLSILVFLFQILEWMSGRTSKPVENVNLVMGAGLFGFQMFTLGILAKLIVITRTPHRRIDE